jgi:hypothetical protein
MRSRRLVRRQHKLRLPLLASWVQYSYQRTSLIESCDFKGGKRDVELHALAHPKSTFLVLAQDNAL